MRKTLFVVEGQTEQVFILHFLQSLVAIKNFHVSLRKYHNREILEIENRGPAPQDTSHYIQILNVEGDEMVNSFINDNISNIQSKGYVAVFGLRDKFSRSRTKKAVDPTLIDTWTTSLSELHGIAVEITVAVEEVEAWFLAEYTLFEKIHPSLSHEKIREITGLEFSKCDVQAIEHPAEIIDKIYASVGMRYKKRIGDSYKIATAINYDELYLSLPGRLPPLKRLAAHLDHALL